MKKANGYFKEWSVSLRTDDANQYNRAPLNGLGQQAKTVDGLSWVWNVHWMDILPPDFPSNSSFRVTHFFTPDAASIIPLDTDVTDVPVAIQNLDPSRTRSVIFTSSLANRSVLSSNNKGQDTNGNPLHGPNNPTAFRPGFINTLFASNVGAGPLFLSSTVTNYGSTSVAVCYRTNPFTFISYAPETHSNIVIETWEANSSIANTLYNNIDTNINYPSIYGIHTFTFKLIE